MKEIAKCRDCEYRIYEYNDAVTDLLCMGRCLRCHIKWLARSAPGGRL